ncbi:hypothetical protein ABRQ22_16500 [Cellulosimicrobium sp. ES-005]|uniref:Uncharacterized protein n=1 Tax=Cellulosimicrobium sp. ES-005 TaxID=3163031 RepID=A0AAU8FX30_9MICO
MSPEQSPVPDADAPDGSAAPDAVRGTAPDAASDVEPDAAPSAPLASAGADGAVPVGAAGTGRAEREAEAADATEAADEVEIETVVDPGTVRRAPRYGAFFTVGVVLGTVLGLGIGGAWLQSPAAAPVFKPGVYFTVIVVTCAALGAAVAGLWAVLADRRSLRGRR